MNDLKAIAIMILLLPLTVFIGVSFGYGAIELTVGFDELIEHGKMYFYSIAFVLFIIWFVGFKFFILIPVFAHFGVIEKVKIDSLARYELILLKWYTKGIRDYIRRVEKSANN